MLISLSNILSNSFWSFWVIPWYEVADSPSKSSYPIYYKTFPLLQLCRLFHHQPLRDRTQRCPETAIEYSPEPCVVSCSPLLCPSPVSRPSAAAQNLQELESMGCALTSESYLDLASVPANNPHLWSPDLENSLKDAGLHNLCDAFKKFKLPHSEARIGKLRFNPCLLSGSLKSFFCSSQSLVQMNLIKNALSYNTIRNLC